MRWGIQTLSPQFFGGLPDLAVSGPNVGSKYHRISLWSCETYSRIVFLPPANLGSVVLVSGTVYVFVFLGAIL